MHSFVAAELAHDCKANILLSSEKGLWPGETARLNKSELKIMV
jgi:hypothetical protein